MVETNMLPNFQHYTSSTGIVAAKWRPDNLPTDVATAWFVVVLRHLEKTAIGALLAGDFRNDLVRIPAKMTQISQELHVPVERPLTILLIIRDEKGNILPSPDVLLSDVAPECSPAVVTAKHESAFPELVFVDGASQPDLQTLAQGVANAISGRTAPPKRRENVGSFGTKQRWYLNRITWPPSPHPLLLVARHTFIAPNDLDQWKTDPPEEAIPLPPACDSIIDATAEENRVMFYAVLEGPTNWKPLALSPVLPPFDSVSAPYVHGDAEARLVEAFQAMQERLNNKALVSSDLTGLLDLWQAVVSPLIGTEIRSNVLSWVEETRTAVLF